MVQDNSNQRTSPRSRELQSALLQGILVAAYRPCMLGCCALHTTNPVPMQPWAATVNHKRCWAWHGSGTVHMDRRGEPQNRRPAEQHQLPLQVRQTDNNSKPTICSGQTKQVYNSVGVTAEHAQVSPKPTSSCIHFLHENLKGFWKPAVSGEVHCRRRLCCLWGQASKSCKQASAPDNLNTRGKPAAPLSAVRSSDQAVQQSVTHLCFYPILTQRCPNYSARSLSGKKQVPLTQNWFTSCKYVTTG